MKARFAIARIAATFTFFNFFSGFIEPWGPFHRNNIVRTRSKGAQVRQEIDACSFWYH